MFRELYPALRRFASMVSDRGTEPDDLVQEALARTLAKHTLSDLDRPVAYLRRAIANLAVNDARRTSRRRDLHLRLVDGGSYRDHYPSDLDQLFRLTPHERAVLFLVDVEGCSFAEVAEITSSTATAERLRASRARRRLRQLMKEDR